MSEIIYQLIFFLSLAFVAEVIGTVGGFGSSVFFVPIAGLFFDFHSVLGITAVFHLSSNISKILLFKDGVDKKILINFGIPAVLFVIAGAFISNYFDSMYLEFGLGIFDNNEPFLSRYEKQSSKTDKGQFIFRRRAFGIYCRFIGNRRCDKRSGTCCLRSRKKCVHCYFRSY